jgi:hypothetical protein
MNICKPVADILELCKLPNNLDNVTIYRESLIGENLYLQIKLVIPELKKYFSSSYLTALQSTAKTQKYPVINILRQLLKVYNYKMEPKRLSNGYDKSGKKLYKRIFIIKQI